MRMKKALCKKILSMVLSLTMTAGALAAMGTPITAEAAEGSGEAEERITAYSPDMEKYATVKNLKKNKYNLSCSSGSIICPVYFGKREGESQRWYIAGYDFKAGNLVLLCDPKEPLEEEIHFLDKDRKQKVIYDELGNEITKSMILEPREGEGTYDNGLPEEVSVNHYGTSLLRKTLQEMETDSSFFAKDEQALMLPTRIYTYDIRNKMQYYTNDKLYTPYCDYSSATNWERKIMVGRNSSTKLGDGVGVSSSRTLSPYNGYPYNNVSGGSYSSFWLRKTDSSYYYPNKYVAIWETYDSETYADVTSGSYEGVQNVVPAFAMDLNNVLFASAVPAETNTAGMEIFQDLAKNKLYPFTMTFRMDGSINNEIKSIVEVDMESDTVYVKGPSAELSDIYLCIQGKDESGQDWYFSKNIKRISPDGITISKDGKKVDLDDCEIWIEKSFSDDDHHMIYAKRATLVSAEMPMADVESGTYEENQMVTLTTNTEGAEIYYTTDGSEPTIDSRRYSRPIAVNGKMGEKVAVTIKALAVKYGKEDSKVAVYEYVIDLPHVHSFGTSWIFDSEAHWHECSGANCTITADSEKDGYGDHTEDEGTITVQPTETSEGSKTYRCSVCRYVMRRETLPKTGNEGPGNEGPGNEGPGNEGPGNEGTGTGGNGNGGTGNGGTGTGGISQPGTGGSTMEETKPAAKNTVLTSAGQKCTVKVTSSSAKNPTVAYMKSTNSKAASITVPSSIIINNVTYKVTGIADNAFANHKKVTKITIGKNVISIGKNAFKNCRKLKTVTINSTVLKSIGANAFSGDKNLKNVTVKSTKLTSKSVGKNAFKGTNKKLIIKVPKKKAAAYKKFFKKKGNVKVTVR